MRCFIFFVFVVLSGNLYAQRPYFVDGYHGGVYGHYPMWMTDFIVDNLVKYPEWRIGLEIEPETWDTVKLKEPEAYTRFAHLVEDKRIEFTNPLYAQPYGYNISGESLIRQFEYGMQKIRTHFPNVKFTTYAVQEPSFTSSLPQLLKQLGFKYAVLKNPGTCWGGYTANYGKDLVNWIGPDGTSILTVPRYASEDFEDESTWQTTAWNNSHSFLQAAFDQGVKNPVGMCYQDAGWDNGPWLGHGKHIKNNSTYVTWTEYFENISSGHTDDDWHFSQDDVRVNLMWGSQALQRIAQDVRKSENKILVAEKISAMANLDRNFEVSEETMREAWRTLMLAQHHDSWIVPYNRLTENQTWEQAVRAWTDSTNELANKVVHDAMKTYSEDNGEVKKGTLGYIRVFNTVGSKRSELVRVELPEEFSNTTDLRIYNSKGEELPFLLEESEKKTWLKFKPSVLSFGYSTFMLTEEASQSPTKQSGVHFDENGNCVVENDMYKMILDKNRGGIIKSLQAKFLDNKEFVEKGNPYEMGEISGHFFDEEKFHSSKDTEAKITILEDHPLLIKVKVEGHVASHPFTQIITLESGQPRIDFDLTVDWKENVGIGEYKQKHNWTDNRRAFTDDRYKLKVMFPNSLSAGKIYKNAPFDVSESALENTFFGQWDEIKHNVILHWVDLVQQDEKYGLALLSDHTTSYLHGTDYPLSLTAQYSGLGLWGINYKITEALNMRYALIPHAGNWDVAQIATQSTYWNEPLIGVYERNGTLEDRSFVSSNMFGLEITTMKVDGDDILLRLFNAEGSDSPQEITLNFPVESVEEVLLNGEKVKYLTAVQNGSTFPIELPRFGITTIKVKKKSDF